MKKFVFAVLISALLLCSVSCAQTKSNLCYYGLFSDSAVMIAFNAKHNTVYDITLPYDAILNWGYQNGVENIPNAIRNYAGAKDSGFMMGSSDTIESLMIINQAIQADLSALSNNTIINTINKLCMTDLTALIVSIDSETEFEKIDAKDFSGTQDYFASWIKQIYGE